MFVHLHTHSHFSLLDGLAKIDQLVSRAKKLKMPAIALTDHGNMYGVIEFYKKAKEAGIKPIIGCEIYLAPRSRLDKTAHVDNSPFHLTLLCKNEVGYKNLLKIVSEAHIKGFYYKPRSDKQFLAEHSEGLIALSGCPAGEIPRLLEAKKENKAIAALKNYQEIFGDDFYIEIQPYHEPAEFKKMTKNLVAFAQKNNIQLVATSDIHYLMAEDRHFHEILLAIQTKKDIDDAKRMSLKDLDLSMISPEKMIEASKDYPEAIENTLKIAEKCNLEFEFGKTILPHFPLPDGVTAEKYLEELVEEGFKKRYDKNNQVAKDRLKYELNVIEKTKFSEYFLIVSDFVNWAKENGITVGPGRGSAAGSIVSYCLNITSLDPIAYNLLFERFLNPERISPPDIDLDFADDRRGEVIEHITKTYGADHVAQIITFGVMKARMATRDVTRALGLPYALGDEIAKLIPMGVTLDQAMDLPEFAQIYNSNADAKTVIDASFKLEGVVRHASTHAAGIVISQDKLVEYVPLQRTTDELGVMTQFAMNDIADIGLLKVDILGLKNLTIIKNCLRIIKKVHHDLKEAEINIEKIPIDNEKAYKLLARGDTIGVFQLESDGMRRYIKELKPTEIKDIIAMVALYRPGPMDLIPDFIAGKHGAKIPEYLHPKLRPILEDTYGIAVYQEQVLHIARAISGFSLGEADILRKAIGKKNRKLLLEQRKKFVEGAVKNEVEKAVAEKIFDFIEPFASYSFNRAHAACYGMIAYQTAYLKANFPQEFMTALLTSERNNIDKIGHIIAEIEKMGMKVLPPDVNESFPEFGVVPNTKNIRFGLAAVKNVGEAISERIVEERKQNGLFKTLEDFLTRMADKQINKKVIESLAKVGAFDNFAERNQILFNIELILKYIQKLNQVDGKNQMDLFGVGGQIIEISALKLLEVEEVDEQQKLLWEKELLGIYLSSHPLKSLSHLVEGKGTPIGDLNEDMTEQKARIAGIVATIKKIQTKNGDPMLFVKVEDLTGTTEVIVFPGLLERSADFWQVNKILMIEGTVNTKDGQVKILADKVREVSGKEDKEGVPRRREDKDDKDVRMPKMPDSITITLPPGAKKNLLLELKKVILENPGQATATLMIPQNSDIKEIKLKAKVSAGKTTLSKLRDLGVMVS